MVTLRSAVLLVLTALIALLAGLAAAACDSSDDEERLAAQRLFRNYLVQSDRTAVADVRIQGAVDELPPSFRSVSRSSCWVRRSRTPRTRGS